MMRGADRARRVDHLIQVAANDLDGTVLDWRIGGLTARAVDAPPTTILPNFIKPVMGMSSIK
jgi:hypothetical protein